MLASVHDNHRPSTRSSELCPGGAYCRSQFVQNGTAHHRSKFCTFVGILSGLQPSGTGSHYLMATNSLPTMHTHGHIHRSIFFTCHILSYYLIISYPHFYSTFTCSLHDLNLKSTFLGLKSAAWGVHQNHRPKSGAAPGYTYDIHVGQRHETVRL